MTVLLAHQAVANPATVVGTAQDVARFDEAQVECFHGFNEAQINTNPQDFLIQTSLSASGNEDWVTVVTHTTATGTPAVEAFSALEPVGETSIAVVDEADSAAGDVIYLRDTVVTDSEWALVREVVVNTSIDIVDGLTRAHAATTTSIWTLAEKFIARMNIKAAVRLRVVYMNEGGTAADTHIKVDGTFRRLRG